MKERLIELIREAHDIEELGMPIDVDAYIADHLFENGVIVPPCKIGDKAYYITGIYNTLIKECRIVEIYVGECSFVYLVNSDYLNFELQEHEIYFTREEAEQKLKEGVKK